MNDEAQAERDALMDEHGRLQAEIERLRTALPPRGTDLVQWEAHLAAQARLSERLRVHREMIAAWRRHRVGDVA